MPLLSIIVPSYNVQAYVGECLDSLLNQSFTDIEIIAVDDCSPDRTGEVLDHYADRDPRVRVLHLEHNAGLGGARNAGLAEATGEYVWFVDSDDWVERHSLPAIAKRLLDDRPDVLMIDYARTYWWLKVQRNAAHWVFPDAPEIFRAGEYTDLFQLFPGAWNKVVRREFLVELDIPFPTGYYEDIPFTYPLLVAAERISMLDRVCLYYRQRRHGSILRTRGERHLELLSQYELVFQRLAQLGDVAAPLLPTVYDRMVDHLLGMLGRKGRVGSEYRKRYFLHATTLCQQHRPAGWREPAGINGIRYRLLEHGSWPVFSLLRSTYQLVRSAKAKARKIRRKVTRYGRKAGGRLKAWSFYQYYRVQTHRPVEENLAVYSFSAGRGYDGNPAAIHEKARELAPSVRGVWVVTEQAAETIPPGVDRAVENSLAYYRSLARAKYLISDVDFPVFVRKRPGSVHVMTHDGTPLKSMGTDLQRYMATSRQDLPVLARCWDRWDYSISSNAYSTEIWERVYPANFRSLEYGYPRNDVLVDHTPEQIAALRERFGIAPDERVVLYAPTYREYQRDFEPLFDFEDFAELLGDGSRLLVRTPARTQGGRNPAVDNDPRILDVTEHGRTADLYLIADVLITDYSSVMFDYAVLDRPIVIHSPDWDAYQMTRGTYFDLLSAAPGLVTRSHHELFDAFRTGAFDTEITRKLRAEFRERFCAFDDGHAAERLVGALMLGRDVQPPAAAIVAAPAGGDDPDAESGSPEKTA